MRYSSFWTNLNLSCEIRKSTVLSFIFLSRLPQSQPEVQQRKLLYMGLYLLIWGEAANVRFMPECLCYIFHNVSTVSNTKTILFLLFPTYPLFTCCLELPVSNEMKFLTGSFSDGIWTSWPVGWECQHCHWGKHQAFLWRGRWGFPSKGHNPSVSCHRKGM